MKQFLPVLAFQKVGTAPKHSRLKKEWTTTARLEKWLTFLKKHHYTCITPTGLANTLPTKPIMLVFMGGYQSFYTDVFPLLQKYNVCATVFVATDTLGAYNRWQDPYQEPWQNVLTVSQLQELVQSKRVAIGTLGLTGENLLSNRAATHAQAELQEAIYRLQTIYKTPACAVGFWPGTKDKQLARTREICAGLNVPALTPAYGKNALDEKQFLKVLKPGVFTVLRLWK